MRQYFAGFFQHSLVQPQELPNFDFSFEVFMWLKDGIMSGVEVTGKSKVCFCYL
jgi:hypothetical protein